MPMKTCLCLTAALIGITVAAQGGIVLSENFTYADGPLVGNGASPWTGHSGTAGQVDVVAGKLNLTFAESQDVGAPLQGAPYTAAGTTSALYASFTVNFSALPGSGAAYFAHFKDAGTVNFRCRIWASTANAAAGSFRLGVGNAASSVSDGELATDLSLNTDYRIVMRYQLATATGTLWLAPTSEGSPSVSATDTASTPDVTAIAFRQAPGIGTMTVDGLLVGTAFADVAGPNLPPTVSSISDQSIPAGGSTGPISFAIGDDETPAAALQVTGSSGNTLLVPNANITLGGTGSIRSVTVTPAAGQQGQAVVTISVNDGSRSTLTTFLVRVGAPSIAPMASQLTPMDTVIGPLTVAVADAEEGPTALTVTATSSSQQLVPDANILVGGAGANRTLTITPAPGQSGVTTITVAASDGHQTAARGFTLTVHPVLGLLLAEDFNRADGALVDGSGTWESHSGTFQQTQLAGGRLALSHNQSEDVNRALTPGTLYSAAAGYVFYAGFTVQFTELPDGAGTYFAHFKDDTTSGFRARIFATTTDAAPGRLRLGIASGGNSVTGGAIHATDLTLGLNYTVIVRLNAGTGESRLWINPTAPGSGFVDSFDNPQALSVASFAFRQSGPTSGMGALTVDDLKVGTAFVDVAGNLPPTIGFTRNGNNLRLSWPSGQGFQLRRAASLPATLWNNVPFTTEGVNDVSNLDVSTGSGFLRLEKN